MNTMMDNIGSYTAFPFYGLHIISVIIFAIGIAFLLFWASKHFSQKILWNWGWILAVIGTILCLLTIPAGFGTYGATGNFRYAGMPMMGGWNVSQGTKSESQQKEEADGKVLYDKLQSKQSTCADLSDNDFELVGEYLMGQQTGASHEQMNTIIKQMMGDDAAMHIFLAKNATGCQTGTESSLPYGGMMNNAGGMMRGAINSSSSAQ